MDRRTVLTHKKFNREMMDWVKGIIIKYKEIIIYGICGIITTLINIAVFHGCYEICAISLFVSNTVAWVLAFVFAFISNKVWVFQSREWAGKRAVREMLSFLFARLSTLLLDTLLMWLMVDVIYMNSTLSKVCSNVITIVINYIASKFIIFKSDRN